MQQDNIEDYFNFSDEASQPLSDAEIEGLRLHFSAWTGTGPSDAAFDFWAKASYWTPGEIAALSLGKNPNQFSLADCEVRSHIYPLCREYLERAMLIARAVETEQLFERNIPGFALAWLDHWKIHYPKQLKEAVESIGHHVADWKQRYLDVSKRARELEAYLQETLGRHDTTLESLRQEITHYENWKQQALIVLSEQADDVDAKEKEIAALTSQLEQMKINGTIPPTGKSLSIREQNNLLKIVKSIAVQKYRYDPKAEKSPATANILSALELQGFSMSADTVRKYLKMAASQVPPKTN